MLGSHFYNQIVRKNIVAFGTLFNNITMKSTDPSDGTVLEEIKVPLGIWSKTKVSCSSRRETVRIGK